MEIAQWEAARHQCERLACTFGDPHEETSEQRILYLSKLSRSFPLFALDALEAVEHQEIGTTVHQRIAEKVEESHTLGCTFDSLLICEVAVGLDQEPPGVRFLIEAPNEDSLGTVRAFWLPNVLQKPSCDGGLASAPQPHQSDNTSTVCLPATPKQAELELSS